MLFGSEDGVCGTTGRGSLQNISARSVEYGNIGPSLSKIPIQVHNII